MGFIMNFYNKNNAQTLLNDDTHLSTIDIENKSVDKPVLNICQFIAYDLVLVNYCKPRAYRLQCYHLGALFKYQII